MAYPRYSIGEFDFISLDGGLDTRGQHIVVDSRPGVRGLKFKLLGVKGHPFSLTSLRDYDSLFLAEAYVGIYKDLIAQDPVDVWQNDTPLIGGLCKVLNVTEIARYSIKTAIGNKRSALATAMLVCRWDLITVPLPLP